VRPSVFLDSGYAIALLATDDQYHEPASRHWRTLAAAPSPIVTTSFVVCEVVAMLQRKGRHAAAVEAGTSLMHGEGIEFVYVDESIFQEAWRHLVRHRDKSYSLTDCISFVLMQKRGIRTALAFDHHFIQAGFVTQP
jgi:predicted nucleic acid-binding protein